mgnify:CR=1 FL=1
MKTRRLYPIVALFLFLFSCSKDTPTPTPDPVAPEVVEPPFMNLNTSLSVSSPSVEVEEGNPAVISLQLSEKLSEELAISIEQHTDELINVVNPEDYSTDLEFSVNNGSTWASVSNGSVAFPKESTTLQVRFSTVNDEQLEVHESLWVRITPNPSNGITLSNEAIADVKITVLDNEENTQYFEGFMTFTIENNSNFKLKNISRTVSTTQEKAWIDQGGLPQELLDDIRFLIKSSPVPVVEFSAKYDTENTTLGSVYNLGVGYMDDSDRWVLNMNLAYGFLDSDLEQPISYNENGYFGNTLVHELGHILTLNYHNQINTQISEQASCTTFYDDPYGCMNSDAVLAEFNKAFYKEQEFFEPVAVTAYAETNSGEDIAETFLFYVAQDSIPEAFDYSSGALHKINFVKNNKWLKDFKQLSDSIHLNLDLDYGPIDYKVGRALGSKPSCIWSQKEIMRAVEARR